MTDYSHAILTANLNSRNWDTSREIDNIIDQTSVLSDQLTNENNALKSILNSLRDSNIDKAMAYARFQQVDGFINRIFDKNSASTIKERRAVNLKAIAYAEALYYSQRQPLFIAEMLEFKNTQNMEAPETYLELAQKAAKLVPNIQSPESIKRLVNSRLKKLVSTVEYATPKDTIPTRESLGCAIDFEEWMLSVGQRPSGEKFTKEDVFNVLDENDIAITRALI